MGGREVGHRRDATARPPPPTPPPRGRGAENQTRGGRRLRREPPHLLGKIRLPGVRLHHPGDRAAAVLVQQPVRRLPELRRARRRAAHRRRAGHSRQGAHLAPRRHRAVGEIELALLRADAARLGQALPLHPRNQVEGSAEEDAGRDPLRLRRNRDPLRLRRRHARLRDQAAVRGRRSPTSSAASARPTATGRARRSPAISPTCRAKRASGYRLKPEALCVKVGGLHIGEVSELSVKAPRTGSPSYPSGSPPSRTRSPAASSRRSASG